MKMHNRDEESSELQDGIERSLWEEGRCISEDYIINGDGRWHPIEWDMGWVYIDDDVGEFEYIYELQKNPLCRLFLDCNGSLAAYLQPVSGSTCPKWRYERI